MSTYIVGDIQGCRDSLRTLLARVDFRAGDRLWCVGDLVNRGPDSLATLRFLRGLGDAFSTVLGNHDLHYLALVFGGHAQRSADTLGALLTAPDGPSLADWLRHQPMLLETDDAVLAHAGVPHVWDLPAARANARALEQALRGADHPAFFQAMYGDKPTRWNETLSGMARLRVIANYLTRMRLVNADGDMEFAHKGGVEQRLPAGYRPWFSYPSRVSKTIVFGHWAALSGVGPDACHPATPAYGLDTGCSWGRTLSALRLEDRRMFAVPAAESTRAAAP